jgi:hypothetical protein
VVVSPWLIQRHRDWWPQPDAFDPGPVRQDDASREPLREAYLPFGMGPRVCLGAAFALQEAALILASLVRRWHLDPVPGHVPMPVGRLTIRSANGVQGAVAQEGDPLVIKERVAGFLLMLVVPMAIVGYLILVSSASPVPTPGSRGCAGPRPFRQRHRLQRLRMGKCLVARLARSAQVVGPRHHLDHRPFPARPLPARQQARAAGGGPGAAEGAGEADDFLSGSSIGEACITLIR